jgi:hypothetical protein
MRSNEQSGAPMNTPVLVPSQSNDDIVLTWGSAGVGVTYDLSYGTSSGSYPTLVSSNAVSPVTLSGLTTGTTYFFRLVGTNATGTLTALETSILKRGVSCSPTTAVVGLLLSLTGTDYSNLTSATVGNQAALVIKKSSTDATLFVMPVAATGSVSVNINGQTFSKTGFTLGTVGNTTTEQSNIQGSSAPGYAHYYNSLSAEGTHLALFGEAYSSNRGAAYVFLRSGSTWSEQARLQPSDNATNRYFGRNVAINADGSTLFATQLRGSVKGFIFTRANTTWTEETSFIGSDDSGGDDSQGVGASISADGLTVAIGGHKDNSSVGATWVFVKSGGSWSQQGTKLVGTGNMGTSEQEISVSLSADGNTLAVGGQADNSGIGAIWIFVRSGNTWSQQGSKLVVSGTSGALYVGRNVQLNADGNRFVTSTDSGKTNGIAAFVFSRSGSTWSQEQKITYLWRFGSGASINAAGDKLVSCSWNDYQTNACKTYLYTRSGTTWTRTTDIVPSGTFTNSTLGRNCLISSDGKYIGSYAGIFTRWYMFGL